MIRMFVKCSFKDVSAPKRLASWRHSHCSALSVSQFTRLHRKYLGKVTTWFFLVHPYSILLRYLLGHVPCIDMGEKNTSNLQTSGVLTKVPPSTGSSPASTCRCRWSGNLQGYGFRHIMAYVDEFYYDVPPKNPKFPERFNPCGSFNDEYSWQSSVHLQLQFCWVRPFIPLFKGFLFQRLICVSFKWSFGWFTHWLIENPKLQSARWNFLLGSFNKSMLDCV